MRSPRSRAPSLSLFCLCGYSGLCPGQGWVDEFDGGGGVVPSAVLAGFPDGLGVVPGAFDGARVGVPAARVEVPRAGDLGGSAFEGRLQIRGRAGSLTRRRTMRTALLNFTRSGSMPAAVSAVQISALIA